MKYIIIEKNNFADLEKIQSEAKKRTDASYKLDQWQHYEHGTLAIIGEAVKMFCEKYGYTFAGEETIKTDGKTSAEIIPCITPSYYYDARDQRGGLTDIYTHSKIGCLVRYNGVLLDHYKKHYNSDLREFRLFNDQTDYRTYLPYKWGENNPSPNFVGTITDKKINDWLNWLNLRKAAAEEVRNLSENRVALFMEKIRGFNTSGCSDYKITENSGYFVRNGLRYSYEIETGGYISESIKVDTTCNLSNVDTLGKFELMTTGNFK
jgi:hypothetical protein